eukprot:12937161-Prorocentrum_lima.AAC.1
MVTSGSTSSGIPQGGQVWPRVQFRQMTEMNLDANALEELTRLATQSWAMMNQEGESQLQLQQSIETVANELTR